MNTETVQLWLIRFKSFCRSAFVMLVSVVVAWIASDDFAALITEHFGPTTALIFATVIVPEILKHVHNLRVIAGRKYGSNWRGEAEMTPFI